MNKNWEDIKQEQSDHLKILYPDWNGNYDGSEPAILAEFMNVSYKVGKQEEREIIQNIVKEMPDTFPEFESDDYDEAYQDAKQYILNKLQ